MLNQNQVQILYLYDVYWLARWLLFMGSKCLEYISSIRTMHKWHKNCQQSAMKQLDKYVWITIESLEWAERMPTKMHNVNTQYEQFNNSLGRYFNTGRIMKTAGKRRNLLSAQGTSRDTLHRPQGITLIESSKIRWFSRWSDGAGWSLLSEAKRPKTTVLSQVKSRGTIRLESTQIR